MLGLENLQMILGEIILIKRNSSKNNSRNKGIDGTKMTDTSEST
jgi:hypothetical protein